MNVEATGEAPESNREGGAGLGIRCETIRPSAPESESGLFAAAAARLAITPLGPLPVTPLPRAAAERPGKHASRRPGARKRMVSNASFEEKRRSPVTRTVGFVVLVVLTAAATVTTAGALGLVR